MNLSVLCFAIDSSPRQKKPVPFRFRVYRKRRKNSICVGSFFLFDLKRRLQIGGETNLSVTAMPCQLPLGRGANKKSPVFR